MERAQQRHSVPLYGQLASTLRARIEAGQWPVGTRLPSIEALARDFGVARATMRQAIEVLEGEGLVRRSHGRGTFVESEPRRQRWLSLASDWDSLIRMIETLEPMLLQVEAAERQPRILEEEGRPVPAYQYLRRVHYSDGKPFCLIDIYLAASIYLQQPERFRHAVILPILARMPELEIARASQTLVIDGAAPEVAEQLDLPLGAPVAKVRRTVADAGGWCIYVADVVYRGDVIKLDIDLSPQKAVSAGTF